jgi:asparagine synthase (glutamine-hydrolysing)
MTAASGLHGLFRLDGGPVDAADAATLGLSVADPAGPAACTACDAMEPGAAHRHDGDGATTLLAGHVDEAAALASRLGLAADAPAALLARAALQRFGTDTPAEMLGEWSLLDWRARERRLVLMVSAARRDRLVYAVAGPRCAVGPDLFRLARLPWVGGAIDEAGLLLRVGRAGLRRRIGDTTMLQRVREVPPGGTVTITAAGVTTARTTVLTPQPRWTGSAADAVAAAEALLRRIVGERWARTAAPALLLSGGLDSSLLAWALAAEAEFGRALTFLTSVAPPGSGIPDEAEHARRVAAALGRAVVPVVPAPEADGFRPPDHVLRAAGGPVLGNRHALTEAFQQAGRAQGATMLVNGTYGEMTLTGRLMLRRPAERLRAVAGRLRRGEWRRPAPMDAFHIRIAPHRLARLPDAVAEGVADALPPPVVAQRRGEPWGYVPGVEQGLALPNLFYPAALRMDYPFRDLRLLRLFAGFPQAVLAQGGLDRAPARLILQGRLPDEVRLRTRGMPAFPDNLVRLRRQAEAARGRIPAFRAAAVDEWLDLDWLDAALARVSARGFAHIGDANQVQLTAINAELLTWWRTRA